MLIKFIILTVVLVFAAFSAAAGQVSTAQMPVSRNSVDELEAMSQQLMEAAQRHDNAVLERLLAEDFTVIHPASERVTTRAEWLTALPRMNTKTFRYEHLKVVHYSPSLAVVSALIIMDALMDGRPFPPVTAITDVWEKRGDKWQVVTRYSMRPEELRANPTATK